jgi:hypothetical protein
MLSTISNSTNDTVSKPMNIFKQQEIGKNTTLQLSKYSTLSSAQFTGNSSFLMLGTSGTKVK